MEKDKNDRDYSNRTSFNGRPCRPDHELVPFVLNDEVRKDSKNAGLKEGYGESWTIGTNEVPVAFAPVPKGQKEDNMKEFSRDVKRFITDNAEDSSRDESLDEIMEKIYREEDRAWDPTGTTYHEDLNWALWMIDMLIDDVAAKNPVMGQIIRLLSEGYNKKEILEIVKLNKGKTQGYAFIAKAQSLAKEIYLQNYN